MRINRYVRLYRGQKAPPESKQAKKAVINTILAVEMMPQPVGGTHSMRGGLVSPGFAAPLDRSGRILDSNPWHEIPDNCVGVRQINNRWFWLVNAKLVISDQFKSASSTIREAVIKEIEKQQREEEDDQEEQ